MDLDTVLQLERMAVDANRGKIHAAPQEPEGVYYLQQCDGRLERVVAQQKPRCHEFYTFDDLCEAVDCFGAVTHETPARVVFVGRSEVTVLLDEIGNRWERLVLKLPLSSECETVKGCQNRIEHNQRGFLRILRINLAGCVDECLVARFAALKFSKAVDGTSEMTHGKDSMSRAIIQEVASGGNPLPSSLDVTFSIYRDLVDEEVRQTVKCAVDVNVEGSHFCLIPLAGEMERAQRETDLWIKNQVIKRLGPAVYVFCGRPG
jgi:hypothetical protein